MKWKIEASLVSISTTIGSDDEASDYKVTVVTPIIEESGADTIFIKAAFNRWSEGDSNEKLDLVVISELRVEEQCRRISTWSLDFRVSIGASSRPSTGNSSLTPPDFQLVVNRVRQDICQRPTT